MASELTSGGAWSRFRTKHPTLAQFLVFFVLSNGVTILQMVLMPLLKALLDQTALVGIPFQILPIGRDLDGGQYFVFNYAAGPVAADGTGGGLSYFLSVQVTMALAQTINFFLQRNVTFKSGGSVKKAAAWYAAAYVVITVLAGALQGLYKAPIYSVLMAAMGAPGQAAADAVTMLINCAVSFWVYFPIFKFIFRR